MAWLLCVLLGVTAGCSERYPPRFPVSGRVVFRDGSPVKTGTVEFSLPDSRWTASGTIDRDGKFSLTTVRPNDGAIAGEHRVIVRQLIVVYQTPVGGHDHGQLVDTKYSDYRTSPLKVTVAAPGNSDVVLKVDSLPK